MCLVYSYVVDHYSREERRAYTNSWRQRRREKAILQLGGKCVHCGSTSNLEFDHIDPSTKVLHIASMWTASEVKFQTELAKCQLLCTACHDVKTALDLTPPHGSLGRYGRKHKCRCDLCRNAHNAYQREWKRKRRQGGVAE